MDLLKVSLEPLKNRKIALLGYGNQGRAQALNLRDSGIEFSLGCRPGPGRREAAADGFQPVDLMEAVRGAEVVLFLLADSAIPGVYAALLPYLQRQRALVGFSHGYAVHFKQVELVDGCSYFLVAPRGAGVVLRERFKKGSGLPGVFSVIEGADEGTREVALAYARAIGIRKTLLETTFKEETVCDLFGEQAVLCGGVMELVEAAFSKLVERGYSKEMALFECCYELQTIADLLIAKGPAGMRESISPTAFYGGVTRGQQVAEGLEAKLNRVLDDIESGAFAKEWAREVETGTPKLRDELDRIRKSALEKTFTETFGETRGEDTP